MQTSTEGSRERRKSASPRIPVDLLVELCVAEERRGRGAEGAGSDRMLDSWSDVSESFADSYDADGLDLSATGLRLRSAVLPDVGQRLRCRFDLPETEAKCEAEGEVVWSNDAGRHGEFGLRFEALSPAVESALARWVMDRGPTTLPGTEPAPGAPRPQIARVRLDGVSTALEAEISLRDELRLDVEQPLPFLELGRLATVDADGTTERRRLEHVSLRIENGVPKLILGLVAAPSSSAGTLEAPASDETDEPAEARAEIAQARTVEARPAESTVQDEELDSLLARAEEPAVTSSAGSWVTDDAPAPSEDEELEAQAAAPAVRSKKALFGPAEDSLEDEDPRTVARRRRKLDEVRRVLLDGEELPEVPSSSAGAELAAAPRALDGLKQRARAAGAAIAPSIARLTVALRTGWAAFVAGIVPRSKQLYAALAAWIARVGTLVGEQLRARAPRLGAMLTRGAKDKRRTTSPPPASLGRDAAPRRVQRVPGAAPAEVAEVASTTRPRVPLRYVLLGVLALAAVGTLAYALGSGPSEPAPIALPISPPIASAAPEPAPVTTSSVEVAPPPAAEPVLAPSAPSAPAAATTPAGPAGEPSALAAPSTDEGRLPMPGYPSIARGEASPSSASSAPVATASPSAAPPGPAPVVSSGRSFGAENVERGLTTTLRLSLAPSGLEGQADAHGFTVTIRGALSLDRAAAIARSNPAVDRASILNRGDHSVLDVRFVEGRSPAYRVALRGEQLDVTIGR